MKNTNHLHTHFAYIFKMAMKRILHVIKQQVTPVRDNMIWWKQFPKESRILFEFKEPADIEKFTLHSDKPFGGRSECSLSIVEDETKKTFGRFSGHIQLTPGIPGTVLGKKSFCAFRSPVFRPPLNLADYIGLEMRVRTSNHGFVFNIHPDNMVPSDLFQGFIVIPHRDWATIQLPFANMAYTGYGYGKFEKKLLDTKNILSFNIAIHETKDTDFCFDIEYIKGINELDVEGKRPEMKKGMEKELMKTVDLKERAPPS